jgi:hypothetical protein
VKSSLLPFSSALALLLVPSLARAGDVPLAVWVEQRVNKALVQPLAKQESTRSRFSRERPPPRERRVRALQPDASIDKRDKQFVPFAIDVRFGSEWQERDVVGCVYRTTGEIYVKIGDGYRPAAFLLGKSAEPVAGVCEVKPPPPS